MSQLTANEGPLAVTEPVMMEVLAGARTDEQEEDLRRLLLRFDLLQLDSSADVDGPCGHAYVRND